MGLCTCETGFFNTGTPSCKSVEALTVKDFIVPKYDSTGALNKYDPSVALTSAFLTGKLNAPNPLDRWYPVGKFYAVESTRDAVVTETIDNIPFFITNGNKTFTASLLETSGVLIGALEALRCQEFGVFKVKEDNTMAGIVIGSDGFLYPIPVESGSISVLPIDKTVTTLAKLSYSYTYKNEFSDADIRLVSPTTASLVGAEGLKDVTATFSGISQTGFTVKLKTKYGKLGSEQVVKGLVAADFSLYNVTDSLAVVITSVSFANDEYTFVIPSQTVADVLRLTPTKNGFDFSAVVATTFVVV